MNYSHPTQTNAATGANMRTPDKLRAAQQRIVTDLYERNDLLVVLGMGGGKTASALTAFAELQRDGVYDCLLVAAPAGVTLHRIWEQEPPRWTHLTQLRVCTLIGTPKQRESLMKTPADVYVVSHNNLVKTLQAWPYDKARTVLCFDEFSRLKSPKSATAKGILKHGKDLGAIWGLTGTPRPNGYLDVYQPYAVLSRGRIWQGKSFWAWRAANFMPLDPKWYTCKLHEFRRREIEAAIAPYTLVVSSAEADADLPPMNCGPDFDFTVELAPAAREAYRKMAQSLLATVNGKTVLAQSRAVAQAKLEQIVQGFLYDEQGEPTGWTVPTKAQRLAEVLDEIGHDDPTLICYWFREDVQGLRKVLGADLPAIGGGIPDKTKAALIEQWNRGELRRLAIHPQSVGHGVELQHGGRRIIWYCPIWSPELYAQTIKRISRPGQKRPVFVHRMIAAQTIDLVKIARCEGKLESESEFIDALRGWAQQ